jgi:hypothetical protein
MRFVKRMQGAAALAMALLIGLGLSAPPAQAGFIVTLMEQGNNVVATGSGTIDLAGLFFIGNGMDSASIYPAKGIISTGPTSATPIDLYEGGNGPTSFGSRAPTLADSGSGDIVGIFAPNHLIWVPAGYVSGNALSEAATYNNQTFTDLGVTRPAPTYGPGGAGRTPTVSRSRSDPRRCPSLRR